MYKAITYYSNHRKTTNSHVQVQFITLKFYRLPDVTFFRLCVLITQNLRPNSKESWRHIWTYATVALMTYQGWIAWTSQFQFLCLTYRAAKILPSEVKSFTLVNSNGNLINGRELGLLLYGGGTVCDDRFSDNAADAICKQMNYNRSVRWTRESFDIQVDVNVLLVVFDELWFLISLCHVCATTLKCFIWFMLF